MSQGDKVMNPQHFGSDLADIWIRTRINLEIRIQSLDHFWGWTPWWRFALYERSLVDLLLLLTESTWLLTSVNRFTGW